MAKNKNPEETVNRIIDVASTLFLEKGYENTTIQDILDELKDLSKGAIYHHFKSKEELFHAFAMRLSDISTIQTTIENSKNLNGLEKLKIIINENIFSNHQDILLPVLPDLMKNPKLLATIIRPVTNGELTKCILPIIQEGINDGSITTKHPKEASELILLLFNIYLNPSIFMADSSEVEQRLIFVKDILDKIGLPIIEQKHIVRVKEISNKYNQNI